MKTKLYQINAYTRKMENNLIGALMKMPFKAEHLGVYNNYTGDGAFHTFVVDKKTYKYLKKGR